MSLRLRELEVFRAVMEAGSVTAAAVALHVTQPAVSKMLVQLEEQLGFACFLRQQGRLIATAEGRALLPEVIKALAGIESTARFAEDLRSTRSGIVSIASVPSIATSLLPPTIEAFRGTRPDVKILLTSATNHEIIRLVAERRADLGFVLLPTNDQQTASRDLCAAKLVCVMPRSHELAAHRTVSVADVARFPLISLTRQQPIGFLAEQAFIREGLPYSIAIEVTQSATALALIAAGAGIAVMDGFTPLEPGHAALISRPLDPAVQVTCRLIWSRSQRLSRIASIFMEYIDMEKYHSPPQGG